MAIASRGAKMAVDWEQRVDFDRLRRASAGPTRRPRLRRRTSERCCSSIRTTCATSRAPRSARGRRDKNIRFALLFREDDPILWDFGSAAKHHQLYCPWLPETSWRAWVPPMRGAMPDATGVPDDLAELVADELRERGLPSEPIGVDVPDMTTMLALQRKGIHLTDSQPMMLEARKIKSEDELALLDQAAGIVDAVYEEIYEMLRPGVPRTRSSPRR